MSIETMTKLATYTVGAGGLQYPTFTNIPQGYTDLILKISCRSATSAYLDGLYFTVDSDTNSSVPYRAIYASGASGYGSYTGTLTGGQVPIGTENSATSTANNFSTTEVYISNYSSPIYKTYYSDSTSETGDTTNGTIRMVSGTINSTLPITSLHFFNDGGSLFVQNSTFTLYGIKTARATVGNSIKANGGTIAFDGTYVYHAFTGTDTFVPTQPLVADIVVVAGGGGGGGSGAATSNGRGGGGGAGGLLGFTGQQLNAGTSYLATVGAGGLLGSKSGVTGGSGVYTGGNGSNSQFSTLTAAVGGGGGGSGNNSGTGTSSRNGGNGGSGGGAATYYGAGTAGTGTVGQGNNGGGALETSPAYGGGGGGGAGGAGVTGTASIGGAGGIGVNTYASWLAALGFTATSGYLAGGGGAGCYYENTGGNGGLGGGGGPNILSTNGVAGIPGTGGGGSGAADGYYAGAGGSGLIMVRYKA